MRRAIQLLQSLHRLHGDEIGPQAVLDLSAALPDEKIGETADRWLPPEHGCGCDGGSVLVCVGETFAVCRTNDFSKLGALSASLSALIGHHHFSVSSSCAIGVLASSLLADGYPVDQIIAQMLEHIAASSDLGDRQKAQVATDIAVADKKLTDGATPPDSPQIPLDSPRFPRFP